MSQNLFIFPRDRGGNKTYLKPPPGKYVKTPLMKSCDVIFVDVFNPLDKYHEKLDPATPRIPTKSPFQLNKNSELQGHPWKNPLLPKPELRGSSPAIIQTPIIWDPRCFTIFLKDVSTAVPPVYLL